MMIVVKAEKRTLTTDRGGSADIDARSTARHVGHWAPRRQTSGERSLQVTLTAAILLAAWIYIRPLGLTGTAGLTLVLLIVNSILIVARHLPPGLLSYPAEVVLMASWAFAAAALLSLRSLGIEAAFAYFMAGQAGYRLRPRAALTVAGALGVLSAAGLWLAADRGLPASLWPVGLTVTLPVFIGMANRSRDLAIASALRAADAAQRAAESEARAQALAERARISRDIHDVLAHSLSGVSMQLELSEALLEGGRTDRAREAIARAHSMVREGMAEVRRAVTTARAEVLPLGTTLRSLFSTVTEMSIGGEARELPVEATQTLIRAAQESLTNARRHAPGALVIAELSYRSDAVRLDVANGPAPAGEAARPTAGSGMGLVGMRERAVLLDGQVEAGPITAGPLCGGWRVSVTLPV